MTEAERAERLARLQHRRTSTGGDTGSVAQVFAPPTVAPSVTAPTIDVPTARRGRRSPATTAKIVTVGASTTAVLGIMASFGIAEHRASGQPVLLPLDETAAPATAATAVPTAATAPTSTAPPQVIVVVIDRATGLPVSGDFDLSELAASPPAAAGDPATTTSTAVPTAPVQPTAPAPAPVVAPTAVDLAVPAPPPPPAPVAAPSSAPAPQPVATSSGS